MTMDKTVLRDKIYGCWFGKCLGGAVGMPYEGVPYTVNMTEESIHLSDVPNDDLELQLVWLETLRTHGISLRCADLGEIWKKRIPCGCDEYSIALYNLAHGIIPPASGWKNNFFADGMGATIRSEIWALIFAGRPDAAGFFASQDAQVDHWGDGVRGEVFMAMAEAHACQHSDTEKALRFALEKTAPDSRLRKTLERVFAMYDSGVGDQEARNELLLHEQRTANFTDCVMNLAFAVHSLLRGKGDFLKTVLEAVSFGRDTDCTAATCGAFLGIDRGMKAFPEKWRALVKNQLTLSDFVLAIPNVPKTLDDLTAQTLELHDRLAAELPADPYPAYVPYEPAPDLPEVWHSEWLVLDGSLHDTAAIGETLSQTGRVPEELKAKVVSFDTPYMDLSPYGNNVGCLHLFSFLEVSNGETPRNELVFMAAADVGIRVWMDGVRILNHHSRQKMIPAFHRTEGGSSFHLPVECGSRHLFHVELFNCTVPVKCCIMFGNTNNDLIDGFDFRIPAGHGVQ